MVPNAVFARLVARPIDRVHIAASTAPSRDAIDRIAGLKVPAIEAAFVVSFLSRDPMPWDEVKVPLRYVPEAVVRARLDRCAAAGVITFDGKFAAYTSAGAQAALALLDVRAAALDTLWSNTPHQVSELVALIEPVALAATNANKPSSVIVDQALSAGRPTAGSELWRSLAKVRRYRADCHAEAWSEAGHTTESIAALAGDAPERAPIEHQTDEANAEIWAMLPESEQLRFLSLLASLDGSGTPN